MEEHSIHGRFVISYLVIVFMMYVFSIIKNPSYFGVFISVPLMCLLLIPIIAAIKITIASIQTYKNLKDQSDFYSSFEHVLNKRYELISTNKRIYYIISIVGIIISLFFTKNIYFISAGLMLSVLGIALYIKD